MSKNQNIDFGQFTEYLQVPQGISKEDAWERLQMRIEYNEKSISPPRKNIVVYTLSSFLAAAAIFYALFHFGFNSQPIFSSVVATHFGEVEKCWLPDSSMIELNSNSSVSYRYNKLNKKRSVLLKGDALFEVKKGSEFKVAFFGGEVSVKGTSFYVSAYSPNLLQIDCIEGAVEVTLNNSVYQLAKGDGIKSFRGTTPTPYFCNENDVRNRLKGIFYWERVTLAEIDELSEYRFGYNIILAPGLESRNFSGQLDLSDLQGCLTIVSMAMNVVYSIDEERKTILLDAK
jgi:ferric-dicitrate binding protein FerR (iron transport regulator)